MKTIQHSVLIPGTKVLFFSKGMPHTGIVEEVFENVCEIKDITFLNETLDSPVWKIKTEDLIKTDRFYLPKYPTASEIIYTSAIINQCYTNKDCNDLYYEAFEKLFPKKTLFREGPFASIFPERYIEFSDGNMIIELKNCDGKVYETLDVLIDSSVKYSVLEEFSTIDDWCRDCPSRILVPAWKDSSRRGSVDISIAYKKTVEHIQQIYADDIDVDGIIKSPDIDENSIDKIWIPNERLMEESIINDSFYTDHSSFVKGDKSSLEVISRNLNRIY